MKEYNLKLQDIQAGFLPITRLYDYMRLVDPVKKQVELDIYPQAGVENHRNAPCYNVWHQGGICDNCISVRAYNDGGTYVKIEYDGDKLFLVTAATLEVGEKQMVLELMKDITENGFLNIRGKQADEIYQMVGEINDLIVRDMLTGTYNKRYAYERLPCDMYACRKGSSLSVIFASIDNLELIKSAYGYIAGDYLVKDFTQILRQYCQDWHDAWLARFGETEFLFVLPDTPGEKARQFCDQIQQVMNKTKFGFQGVETPIRSSFGIYTLDKKEEFLTDDLSYQVDLSIARARDQARSNRIDPWYDTFTETISLSNREREVAKLLLEGRSNEDIAQVLFVGIPTVKKHLSSIYQKAGVNSRSEFLARYQNYQSVYLA